MIFFNTTIQKFDEQGDKTGWTYILVASEKAQLLMPGNKKSFRIRGYLDNYEFEGLSLLPFGGGDFIFALNGPIRKAIGKGKGATVAVQLEVDHKPFIIPDEFLECLSDEPIALQHFGSLAPSHQKYYVKWIYEAKTEETKAKRIASSIKALANKWDYGTMIRSEKQNRFDQLKG